MDPDRAREVVTAIPPRRLRLDELIRGLPTTDATTVGQLVDTAAEAGFGFLIGVLTIVAIPFVGLSTPFGLALALLGAQLALGMTHPWLPQRLRRRPLHKAMLDRVGAMLDRRTRWLARATRRRLEFIITPRLVGLGVLALALGLALPLPIPGSNLIFLVPLLIYAIGLLERDGVWILIGHVAVALHTALAIVFSNVIVAVLERLF